VKKKKRFRWKEKERINKYRKFASGMDGRQIKEMIEKIKNIQKDEGSQWKIAQIGKGKTQ
jgi:DNA-directed RNA polymerase subunit F